MKWNEESKGLGDTMAEKIAEVMGAKDCGCDDRQRKLNKMFPYKTRAEKFPKR